MSRPGLFGRLEASARVTVVSAPPGSGKTVLLRSWIGEAGLAERAAWVPVGREERDPQRFWLNLQARYDLEIEKDRLGGALDDIRPLSAAS